MMEEHECYACGVYQSHMIVVATVDGHETLWACEDTAWCRARIVADRLFSDPRIEKVE